MSAVEGPIYRQILGVASDTVDETVTFALGADRGHGFSANLSLGLVGPFIAALTAECEKLNAGVTSAVEVQAPTLNCSAVSLSQDIEGSPVIVFELANGSPLPFALKDVDLAALAADLSLLARQPSGLPN